MQLHCPGCRVLLRVDDEKYKDKALLQCPECLYVFLATAEEAAEPAAGEAAAEEATLLASDFSPAGDPREFQWNVPGASLTIIEGDKQGIHRRLREDRLIIGRKGAALAVEDKAISRLHCELTKAADGWRLRDLGSTNGTYLNGQRIEEAKLSHLDEIRLGKTRILFAETEAPEERAPMEREEEEPRLDQTKADDKSREPDLPLPIGRELYLEFMTAPKKGRSVKLTTGRVILGRGEDADLKLDDEGVSRKHAMIEAYSREQIYITDLASQNGTWLNGMRIRTTKLLHGDLLRLGNTVLKFVVQDLPGA